MSFCNKSCFRLETALVAKGVNSLILIVHKQLMKPLLCMNRYFYSTTFFMAVMAARNSAPQTSIE